MLSFFCRRYAVILVWAWSLLASIALCSGFAQAPASKPISTLDSLKRAFTMAKEDIEKVRLLNRLAEEQQSDPATSRATAERAKALAERLGDDIGMAQALNMIAFLQNQQGNYTEATSAAQGALARAISANDRHQIAKAYRMLGATQVPQGKYDAALELFFQALPIIEELHDNKGLTSTLGSIATAYSSIGNFSRSMEYNRKALALAQVTGNTRSQAILLNNIGDNYMQLRHYDTALTYFRRSHALGKQMSDNNQIAMTLMNIGEAQMHIHQYNEARQVLLRALHLWENLANSANISYILRVLAELATAEGKAQEAIRFGTQAVVIADSIGARTDKQNAIKALGEAYTAAGNTKEALRLYKNYILLRDSIVSYETTQKAAFYENKYAANKKDREILLLQKEREKQTLVERQQRFVIVSTLLALVLALAFGMLLARSNRIQKRDNRRLQAMSRIGSDLATSLVFEEVVLKIHGEVQQIMDAPIFNIGVYLPSEERIEFRYLIENGEFVPPPSVPMSDKARPAVQCVEQRKVIVINDQDIPILVGTKPQSLVYVPLIANNSVIGVFSVQSLQKNSYSSGKVEFLRAISSHIATALENVQAVEQIKQQREALAHEREKSERLLLSVLPAPIAERMKAGETSIAEHFPSVSVLFADVVGFTQLSTTVNPRELVALLDALFSALDGLAAKYRLEKIKTIGDAYMVVSGVPIQTEDHCERIARFALEMQAALDEVRQRWTLEGKELGVHSVQMRVGIHTGEAVAGVIGTSKFSYDIWGDTVNIASRMESLGEVGRIHVTEEVYRALCKGMGNDHSSLTIGHLSDGASVTNAPMTNDEATDDQVRMTNDQAPSSDQTTFFFEERGEIEVKGKGALRTWFLTGMQAPTPSLRTTTTTTTTTMTATIITSQASIYAD
jgi:class 3 adenylate cyclase/tetratricopeptide (TPR) repeat protein